jgi:DNA-binding LacI/PurR family transcriptional regulator
MATDGRVTLQDIAAATGLSPASVSFALNNRQGVSEETRRRVVDAAERLGYQRPERRAAEPTTVTVVAERLPVALSSDPFNRPILLGLEASARRHGYRMAMEFVGPEDHPDRERWADGETAGVIVLGGGDLGPDWVQTAAAHHLPVVMVDHFRPGLDLPAVVPDNLAGAYAATRHLQEMGHERIGFIRGPGKYWTLGERLAGYLLAMQRHGPFPRETLVPPRVSHGEDKGYGEMIALLDLPEPERPTAVFAVSDKAAIGAYRAARERGLAIPRDVSVVGFDDIEAARVLDPPLTTVHIPGETIGRVAFERLHRLIAGMERELPAQMRWAIATRLVERESVAPGPRRPAGRR